MSLSKLRLKFSWLASVCVWALMSSAVPVAAQDNPDGQKEKSEISLSLGANKNATAKDVGLPVYPGASPHKENDKDDSATAQLWAWYNQSGFKLVVLKFESKDSPEKISAFYRKALGKYGEVLDCSASSAKANEDAKKSSHGLTCDNTKVQMGSGYLEFKAGTEPEQHLVEIEPSGSGSIFHLLYIKSHGSED